MCKERTYDGTPCEVKVSRTVWSGGKGSDNIKALPITIGGEGDSQKAGIVGSSGYAFLRKKENLLLWFYHGSFFLCLIFIEIKNVPIPLIYKIMKLYVKEFDFLQSKEYN